MNVNIWQLGWVTFGVGQSAVGPWGVVPWHAAYIYGGAQAVDAMPGGAVWRGELEALARQEERHLFAFEGHVTHLTERDSSLLRHLDVEGRTSSGLMMKVGEREAVRREIDKLAAAGYQEIIYTPSGPDVARELTAFARLND